MKVLEDLEDESSYELDKLKLTMSKNVPQTHLQLFLGSKFLLDEEKDFSLKISERSCLITFSRTYTLNGKLVYITRGDKINYPIPIDIMQN